MFTFKNKVLRGDKSQIAFPIRVLHFPLFPAIIYGNNSFFFCLNNPDTSHQEETMDQQNNTKLFREKSLEAVETPESLNDYLRVTSPRVWLVLSAVIALLIGAVLWGIFGRINTTLNVAVTASDGACTCLVPYQSLESVIDSGKVTVDGQDYPLRPDDALQTVIVSEDTSPYLRVLSGLDIGDVAVQVTVSADLPDGVYPGTVVTESLQPMSLLLQ